MPYIESIMNITRLIRISALGAALAIAGSVRADTAADVYRTLGIDSAAVLTGTVLSGKVIPGGEKQVVALTSFLTGKKDRADAVNVRLGIFSRSDDKLETIYTRDLGSETGSSVSNGDLQLIDLDRDGINEIIIAFDSYEDLLIQQRIGEVILFDGKEFTTGWNGPVEYDATKAARNVPAERRDRFLREFDIVNTLRTRGVTLFVNKQVVVIAGERLAEPKLVQETFPLRPNPDY